MDTLSESLKLVIKDAFREVLREPEFRQPAPVSVKAPVHSAPTGSKKLAVKISEAAEMLSLHESSIRRLVDNGSLKASRKTRHILIPLSELERLMKV